jgi:purine nucleoside phosphorylase
MEEKPILGVIGGSGLYAMSELKNTQEHDLDTPFGKPSVPIVTGTIDGKPVAFLARHGIGHHISPSEINYRANIYALKSLGVERIVSITACGSLREDYAPGHIVVPDQLFDFTRGTVMAHVTDYDVWHVSEAPVTVDMVVSTLNKNTEVAQKSVRLLLSNLKPERSCECGKALADALITRRDRIPPATQKRLELIIGKYVK